MPGSLLAVIYPVTPNGVEHKMAQLGGWDGSVVIYPVTPNGVEHIAAEGGIAGEAE